MGEAPRPRYRGTCVVFQDSMVLHGGHDGTRHLCDTHVFHFPTQTWSALIVDGPVPAPRDSHVAAIFGNNMVIYGGSTGSAMGDFYSLTLTGKHTWHPVLAVAKSSVRIHEQYYCGGQFVDYFSCGWNRHHS